MFTVSRTVRCMCPELACIMGPFMVATLMMISRCKWHAIHPNSTTEIYAIWRPVHGIFQPSLLSYCTAEHRAAWDTVEQPPHIHHLDTYYVPSDTEVLPLTRWQGYTDLVFQRSRNSPPSAQMNIEHLRMHYPSDLCLGLPRSQGPQITISCSCRTNKRWVVTIYPNRHIFAELGPTTVGNPLP